MPLFPDDGIAFVLSGTVLAAAQHHVDSPSLPPGQATALPALPELRVPLSPTGPGLEVHQDRILRTPLRSLPLPPFPLSILPAFLLHPDLLRRLLAPLPQAHPSNSQSLGQRTRTPPDRTNPRHLPCHRRTAPRPGRPALPPLPARTNRVRPDRGVFGHRRLRELRVLPVLPFPSEPGGRRQELDDLPLHR